MHRSNEEISELIRKFAPLTCWKVGLHHGSMIYFEMKERVKQKMLDGSEKEVGNCRLLIDADNWQIHQGKQKIVISKDVSREFVENDLAKKFVGENMIDMAFFSEKMLLISFSSDLLIAIGVNGQKEAKDSLFSIFFPDGAVYAASKALGFYKTEHSERSV